MRMCVYIYIYIYYFLQGPPVRGHFIVIVYILIQSYCLTKQNTFYINEAKHGRMSL